MVDTRHPARIFATVNGASTALPSGKRQLIGGWSEDGERSGSAEYVRADLHATLAAEKAELVEALEAIAALAGYTRLHPDENETIEVQGAYSRGVADGYKIAAALATKALSRAKGEKA